MKALSDSVGSQLATKASMYDFMSRRDFFLPESRRSIASIEFLTGVHVGEIYLPKQADVHPVQRVSMPSKKQSREILIEILKRNVGHEHHGAGISRLGQFVEDKDADKTWLLVMIRHFDKDNAIFATGYLAPERPKKVKEEDAEAYEKKQ